MKPITIKARSITPVLEAARELVLACDEVRRAVRKNNDENYRYGYVRLDSDERAAVVRAAEKLSQADSKLASLLGLERDEKTGRYRDG